MIKIGEAPFPIHIDASNVNRVTITRTDGGVIVSIEEAEGEISLFKLNPIGDDEYGYSVRIQDMQTYSGWKKNLDESYVKNKTEREVLCTCEHKKKVHRPDGGICIIEGCTCESFNAKA